MCFDGCMHLLIVLLFFLPMAFMTGATPLTVSLPAKIPFAAFRVFLVDYYCFLLFAIFMFLVMFRYDDDCFCVVEEF